MASILAPEDVVRRSAQSALLSTRAGPNPQPAAAGRRDRVRTSFDAIGSANSLCGTSPGRWCLANTQTAHDRAALNGRAIGEARDKQRPVQSAPCVLTRPAKSAAPQRHDYQGAAAVFRPAAAQRMYPVASSVPIGANKTHRGRKFSAGHGGHHR